MQIFKITCIFVVISTLQVSLDLRPLNNVTENSPIIQKQIKKQQLFRYQSKSLQPINHTNNYCSQNKGQIYIEDKWKLPLQQEKWNEQFLYNKNYNIIYKLNRKTLIAYYYNIDTHKISQISRMDLAFQCIKEFAFSTDEEYLFIFSCPQIYRISTKTILIDIEQIGKLPQQFNPHKAITIQDIMIVLSISQGIRIYGITLSNNLTFIQQISSWNEGAQNFMPQDIVYRDGFLYVLNVQNNIYKFERTQINHFKQKQMISLSSATGLTVFKRIVLWKKNIYIEGVENGEVYITQIQQTNTSYDLVRYYKNYKTIADWFIIQDMLQVFSGHTLNIYNINKDPRTIHNMINGVSSNHLKNVVSIHPLMNNFFITVNVNSIELISIQLKKPYLTCNFTDAQNKIQQIKVIQPCQEQANKEDFSYYFNCQKEVVIQLQLTQNGGMHLWLIFFVVIVAIGVIFQLVLWRKKKITILEKIVTEINKLKNKQNERIDFVEQNFQPARENNWEDIKEQKYQGNLQKEEYADEALEQEIYEDVVVPPTQVQVVNKEND